MENTVSCDQFTLLNLIQSITETVDIPADHCIEFYSNEGYPLHNNDITNHGIVLVSKLFSQFKLKKLVSSHLIVKLQKWGLKDDDLVFSLIRRQRQPGQHQFATLPELDHEIGML